MGRGVDSAVRNIFLLTFIAACSLIQLVTLELSGSENVGSKYSFGLLGTIKYLMSCLYLHPNLRQLAWHVTLYLLCMLLNLVIPLMSAATFFRHKYKRSPWKTAALSVLFLLMYQCYLWAIGEILPVNATRFGFSETPPISLFIFVFNRSLQQSVAHLAAIGTAFSAIINGFASVNFPLEQLMIMKGVDKRVLDERDKTLRSIVHSIIEKKKKLALEVYSVVREEQKLPIPEMNIQKVDTNLDTRLNQKHVSTSFRNVTERTRRGHAGYDPSQIQEEDIPEEEDLSKERKQWGASILVDNPFIRLIVNGMSTVFAVEKTAYMGSMRSEWAHANSGRRKGVHLTKLSLRARSLHKEIVLMEKMCQDCYIENAYFRDLYEQSQSKKSTFGRTLHSLGHFLSVFAFFRFFSSLSAVLGYICRFFSIAESSGLNEISEETYDGVVSAVLEFLSNHLGLPVDVSFWSPLLSFVLVSSLALMQIRGFLDSTRQLSQLSGNWKSVPGELYSLLLAYVAGCYFMACVVLLRVHLPRRFRMGVTAALGEERDFGFYVWWYEVVFVVGTIFAAMYLWAEKRRKRIELEPILKKAKYEERHGQMSSFQNSLGNSIDTTPSTNFFTPSIKRNKT